MSNHEIGLCLARLIVELLQSLSEDNMPKTRCIFESKASSQHVEYLECWIKVLEAIDHAQDGHAAWRHLELHAAMHIAGQLGHLIKAKSFQEGLGDVEAIEFPTIPDANTTTSLRAQRDAVLALV